MGQRPKHLKGHPQFPKLNKRNREPTKEMFLAGDAMKEECIDSGWDSGPDGESHNDYTTISSDISGRIYAAMIDAALQTKTAPAEASAGG